MGKFDANFHLLPPDLKLELGVLALDADVSRVNLVHDFRSDLSIAPYQLGLKYTYGKKIDLFLGHGTSLLTVGVDPANGNSAVSMKYRGFGAGTELDFQDRKLKLDFSYVYRGVDFRAVAGWQRTSLGRTADYGVNVGAKPLPFSDQASPIGPSMKSVLDPAGTAAADIVRYQRIRDSEAAILGRAATLVPQIAEQPQSRYGAGAYIHMDEYNRFSIYFVGTVHFGAGAPAKHRASSH